MSGDSSFDVAALRARYQSERERRLRSDGIDQYLEVAGNFAQYARDPWAEEVVDRDPFFDEVDVALVGAGFGGLLTGARLRELGVDKIRLIDKAADVGGTWYWNRYPGVACDVESYIYMPLLEETGYMPKEKYSKGDEIFEHCQRIATTFDLYRHALFQTEISDMRWDEEIDRWVITTNRDDCFRAKFVSSPLAISRSRNFLGSPVSKHSRATRFTPADGTSTTPAATQTADLRSWRTSASGSSARAQRRCSASPTSAATHKNSSCFSELHLRSMYGRTARPTQVGSRHSPQDGNGNESRTSRFSLLAESSRKTSSMARGQASPRSCWQCASTTPRA